MIFPHKIWLNIFANLYYQDYPFHNKILLAGCSLLCRSFQIACHSLLFRDVELYGPGPIGTERIRALVSILSSNPLLRPAIQHISVVIQVSASDDEEPLAVFAESLEALTQILPDPSNLVSAYINIYDTSTSTGVSPQDIPPSLHVALLKLVSTSNRIRKLTLYGFLYPHRLLPLFQVNDVRLLIIGQSGFQGSDSEMPIQLESLLGHKAYPGVAGDLSRWPNPSTQPLRPRFLVVDAALGAALVKPWRDDGHDLGSAVPVPVVDGASITQLVLYPNLAGYSTVRELLDQTSSLTDLTLYYAGPELRAGRLEILPRHLKNLEHLTIDLDGMDGLEKVFIILSTCPPGDNRLVTLKIPITINRNMHDSEIRWPTPRQNWAKPLFILTPTAFPFLERFDLGILFDQDWNWHNFGSNFRAGEKLYDHLKKLSLEPLKRHMGRIDFRCDISM